MTDATASRGVSLPNMRVAECKDCVREVLAGRRDEGSQYFTYPESWATGQVERGGSRSDRCREHRATHQSHISGVAVAYIDLDTVGEVHDREHPTGPLGALGPLPPPTESPIPLASTWARSGSAWTKHTSLRCSTPSRTRTGAS
jgi:hypothetical protein